MKNALIQQWEREERTPFAGWDFSHLRGRLHEEPPPWNYAALAAERLHRAHAALDMATGGGEFLKILAPFPPVMCATEGVHRNFLLAKERLEPLRVNVHETRETERLPFPDQTFDLVLNRHGSYALPEIHRVLTQNGIFLSEQISGDHLADLQACFDAVSQWPDHTLAKAQEQLPQNGFALLRAEQWQGKCVFSDVGAIVYFLKAIPWCVKGFSVASHLSNLEELQKKVDHGEPLRFTTAPFLILAQKE